MSLERKNQGLGKDDKNQENPKANGHLNSTALLRTSEVRAVIDQIPSLEPRLELWVRGTTYSPLNFTRGIALARAVLQEIADQQTGDLVITEGKEFDTRSYKPFGTVKSVANKLLEFANPPLKLSANKPKKSQTYIHLLRSAAASPSKDSPQGAPASLALGATNPNPPDASPATRSARSAQWWRRLALVALVLVLFPAILAFVFRGGADLPINFASAPQLARERIEGERLVRTPVDPELSQFQTGDEAVIRYSATKPHRARIFYYAGSVEVSDENAAYAPVNDTPADYAVVRPANTPVELRIKLIPETQDQVICFVLVISTDPLPPEFETQLKGELKKPRPKPGRQDQGSSSQPRPPSTDRNFFEFVIIHNAPGNEEPNP